MGALCEFNDYCVYRYRKIVFVMKQIYYYQNFDYYRGIYLCIYYLKWLVF